MAHRVTRALVNLGACLDARAWLREQLDAPPETLWTRCPDASWMLWLWYHVDPRADVECLRPLLTRWYADRVRPHQPHPVASLPDDATLEDLCGAVLDAEQHGRMNLTLALPPASLVRIAQRLRDTQRLLAVAEAIAGHHNEHDDDDALRAVVPVPPPALLAWWHHPTSTGVSPGR